ncbi:MAG TPA: zinc-binding dehydrogenase [Trebonia sp.]|jgi:threonine dehydrogenase-like Zn-dependent dehydrogenase
MNVARASVALPGSASEVREFPVPPAGPDTGWLQVTASGICGTDVSLFARGLPAPTVLGHHVVGRIAGVGDQAAKRWGVRPGDRVALEEYLPCGRCRECARGRYRLCPDTDVWSGGRRIGTVPVAEEPSLFGGNSEVTFLPPNAQLHLLPPELPEDLAVWVLPYANAIDWTQGPGRMSVGESVVVLGPGYHGLAVAAAAAAHGAARVVVTGLSRDAARLEYAAVLGAVTIVTDDAETSGKQVARALGGEPADLVVDTTGGDPRVLDPAAGLLGHGGRLILTTPKSPARVPFDTAAMTRRNLTVTAVRGRAPEAITRAIASLASGNSRLEKVPTVEVSLDETGGMLSRLASGTGPESPHVVVRP